MNKPDSKKILERCERILELPKLLDKAGKQRVALRAEKRTLENRIGDREALVRKEALELSEYQTCKNGDERKATVDWHLRSDPEWEGMRDRLEQLTTAIEKVQHELDILDHERKSLKAALEREYAEIIIQNLDDKTLSNAVSSRRGMVAA